jgi:D-alanyl-D-alanine carboxypeptidase/D-alanyl-D-alanine-endopeptidase (penicillin-binding protein 4)
MKPRLRSAIVRVDSTIASLHAAVAVFVFLTAAAAFADITSAVRSVAGDGVVYVVDAQERVLVDIRGDRPFIPASILKIFTAQLALSNLGLDYRFATEFHLDGDRLVVKGTGDPFLVSEELDLIATALRPRLLGHDLAGIVIDDSYFSPQLRVPGVGRSNNPYDALNAATSVNFNTIAVRRRGNQILSGEPQTPLTPFARDLARARGVKGRERFQIGDRPEDVRRYAGELIAAKLRAAGIRIGEQVTEGRSPDATLLYVHRNSRSLADVCRGMLDSSSNYVANQVFLAAGVAASGSPASLDKSVLAAERFLAAHPQLAGMQVVEGSGIAYENRMTAPAMAALLKMFEPHEGLLKFAQGTRHKTGTLRAVATLAGYLHTAQHGKVRYVIALNGRGQTKRWQIVETLKRGL